MSEEVFAETVDEAGDGDEKLFSNHFDEALVVEDCTGIVVRRIDDNLPLYKG